jgi:hypothetical protein
MFEASEYTTWNQLRRVGKSRRAEIDISFKAADGSDDQVQMVRLDLVGNAKERGFAHGSLLAAEILDFVGPKVRKFSSHFPNTHYRMFFFILCTPS